MNIVQLLQTKLQEAVNNARVYATVYVGTPHKLKKPVVDQMTQQYGKDFIKKSEYIAFYVIKTDLTDDIIQRICNAHNALGTSWQCTVNDIHPIEFENQNKYKHYAFQIITREQAKSYPFLAADNSSFEVGGISNAPDSDDHPLEAIVYAEQNNLGPNETIIDTFTPDMKVKLSKMIKHGEFTKQEGAVLQCLMSEAATLETLAVMLGAKSTRTHGQPMSKPAALKELNRILDVVAKRSQAIIGKRIDLSQIAQFRKEQKRQQIERNKEKREARRREREAYKEFWRLERELHQAQRAHGLPLSRYDKIWTQNTQSLDQMRDDRGQDRI